MSDWPGDLTVLIVPGLRNSGPAHWQTLWTQQLPRVRRVVQAEWDTPQRQPWVDTLAQAVLDIPGRVLIAAHSLGCITTVHLPDRVAQRIAGALLVAPADPERRALLNGFAPVPHAPLPYPSVVVGSRDDPWCPCRLSARYARAWGSTYVLLDAAGHINAESGFGPWPLGLGLLDGLAGQAAIARPCADAASTDAAQDRRRRVRATADLLAQAG